MTYKFEVPGHTKSIIKVIGVGGGGSNAVNYMYHLGIHDVEFFVCNTDLQALRLSPVPNKVQIGGQLTQGLGAGTDPEKGRQAALEDKEKIREMLTDTKMVFITAGMGGGTGTGAAPVLAKIAKEMEILTVGIVTMPFSFEGRKKILLAEQGVQELKEYCDTVIVILNDKIREIHGSLNLKEAFSQADNILTTAAKSIAEIITNPGLINIDFQDVNNVMKQAGAAVMGSATFSGKDRAMKAAEAALHSPLLNNTDITGAKKILVSITASSAENLSLEEYGEINDYYQETAGMDAMLKCGVSIDPSLEDAIRVTVIATGFDANAQQSTEVKTVIDLETSRQTSIFDVEPPKKSDEYIPKVIEAQQGVFKKSPTSDQKVIIDINANPLPKQGDLFQPYTEPSAPSKNYQELDDTKKTKHEKDFEVRITKLTESRTFAEMSNEEFKQRLETPTFIRNKMQLTEVPHSSEREISRFNLNEDNEILGNNKFLHDNVD